MTPDLLAAVLLLPLLLLASALFSASETALFTFQPVRLKNLERTHPEFARHLRRLLAEPRRLLSALVFADALINVPLIVLAVFFIYDVFLTPIPSGATTLIIFTLVVFFGDLLPKLLALIRPLPCARLGLPLMRALLPVLAPVTERLHRAAERLTDLLAPLRFQPRVKLSEDELETLIELSAETGELEEAEGEMIREIIKLNDKTVRDVMTPRVDSFLLPDDLTNADAIRELRDHRHRHVPIYAEDREDIVGVLNVRNFLLDPARPYTEAMDAPSFVPETMRAMDLLRSFLKRRQSLAVIVDEFGGFEGLVTLADITEEILSDAVPAANHTAEFQEVGPNRWLVRASMRLEDLGEELGLEFGQDGIDTIGGLVFHTVSSIPTPGARIDLGPVQCLVRRTSGHRIEQLLLSIEPDAKGAGA